MPLIFHLGGRDLEMAEIARLLTENGAAFLDKRLPWGAAMSNYAAEIAEADAAGFTPVTVELADDMPKDWLPRRRLIQVDHHGPLAGHDKPTSIEQVFALLNLPAQRWSRRLALVAANDKGHIERMRAISANDQEIRDIRTADRAAQGVTQADEAEAVRAIADRRVIGRLTRVDTTSVTSSAIADLILPALGGPGVDQLLVVMPEKLAFFGDGPLIQVLAAEFTGSWWGGDLPARGFWGMAGEPYVRAKAIALIERDAAA